jgi:hypothetical protein
LAGIGPVVITGAGLPHYRDPSAGVNGTPEVGAFPLDERGGRHTMPSRCHRPRSVLSAVAFVSVLLLMVSLVQATSYYVDNTAGSDSNSGTSSAAPWKSLGKVNNTTFQAGDTIHFKRGSVWTGTLQVRHSGTSAAPITYQAYGTGAAPKLRNPGVQWGEAINITGDYNVVRQFLLAEAHEAGIDIQAGADFNTIDDNEITQAGVGVYIRGRNTRVRRNYVHDLRMIVNTAGGNEDYGANCFWVEGANTEVAYNKGVNCRAPSYDFGADGGFIECAGCDGMTVHHNWAENTAGFVEAWGSGMNVTFSYNVLLNTTAANRPPALCVGIPMTGWKFEQNTVILNNSEANGVFGCRNDLTGLTVRNNVFALNSPVANTGNFTHTHNLYHITGGAWVGYALDPGERTGNPLFVNAAAKDFHLQSGSPAINTGTHLGYTQDYDGNSVRVGSAPHMGAYEYGGASPALSPPENLRMEAND